MGEKKELRKKLKNALLVSDEWKASTERCEATFNACRNVLQPTDEPRPDISIFTLGSFVLHMVREVGGKLEQAEESVKQYGERIDELQADAVERRRYTDACENQLMGKLQSLEKTIDSQVTLIKGKNRELNRLEDLSAQRLKRVNELKIDKRQLEVHLDAMQGTNPNHSQHVKELRDAHAEIANLNFRIKHKVMRIDELQETIRNQDRHLNELQGNPREAENIEEIAALKAMLVTSRLRTKEVEVIVRTYAEAEIQKQHEIERLKETVSTLNDEKHALAQMCEVRLETIQGQDEQITSLNADLEQYADQVKDLKAKLEEAARKYHDLANLREFNAHELGRKDDEIKLLKAQNVTQSEILTNMTNQVTEFRKNEAEYFKICAEQPNDILAELTFKELDGGEKPEMAVRSGLPEIKWRPLGGDIDVHSLPTDLTVGELKRIMVDMAKLSSQRERTLRKQHDEIAELGSQVDGLQVALNQVNELAEKRVKELEVFKAIDSVTPRIQDYANLVRTAEGFLTLAHNGLLLGPGYKAARTNLVNALKDLKS